MRTTPPVGRSSVPMMCSSVDLPDPEGPTIATSSPRCTEKDTPRRRGHRRLLAVDLGHARRAPGPRRSQRRHRDAIAFAQVALDLDAPAGGVEQADPHRDQVASLAGAHDLDREAAAGLADQRGDRDAQRARPPPRW